MQFPGDCRLLRLVKKGVTRHATLDSVTVLFRIPRVMEVHQFVLFMGRDDDTVTHFLYKSDGFCIRYDSLNSGADPGGVQGVRTPGPPGPFPPVDHRRI